MTLRLLPWRGGCLCSLLLNLDGFVTNGNNVSKWLPRTSYKNVMDFSLFLLRCSLLEPSHHAMRKPKQPVKRPTWRVQRYPVHSPGWALRRSQHQLCESTNSKADPPAPRSATPAGAMWAEMMCNYWDLCTKYIFGFILRALSFGVGCYEATDNYLN